MHIYRLFLCFFLQVSLFFLVFFFFSSRRRHTRWNCDWSSDVCSSDLVGYAKPRAAHSAFTWIFRGRAASLLGRVSLSTPCSNLASTLSASTGVGRVSSRVNGPAKRSCRCHTALAGSLGLRSPERVSRFPSLTVTSSLSGATSGRSAST